MNAWELMVQWEEEKKKMLKNIFLFMCPVIIKFPCLRSSLSSYSSAAAVALPVEEEEAF